jgi:hypothetical protein
MIFKYPLNIFLKIIIFSKGFFSKNHGSVISYVERNILLAYERFKRSVNDIRNMHCLNLETMCLTH